MKRTVLAIALSLMMVFAIIGSASAITDGALDGTAHPAVVLIVMDVANRPAYTCSGTLINSTTVVTAGHCTYNGTGATKFTGMRIFTESDVQHGDNDFPWGGGNNTIEASEWFVHPLYPTTSFVVHDVGVIKLSEAYELPASKYGVLPTAGQLDKFKTARGVQDIYFTAVGYGLQKSFPDAASWKNVHQYIRMVATPKLNQINVPGFVGTFSLLLSNNARTGGTCFGDSGGPNFLRSSMVIAGVTSFGINGNCAGTGGVFRLDKADVIDFINSHSN